MKTSYISNKLLLIWLLLSAGLSGCTQNLPIKSSNKCSVQYPSLDTIITSHTEFTKSHYPKRIKAFMLDTLAKGDIIMLGNSLTEHGGNWADKLQNSKVKNRGIKGDNTYGILARLDEIICANPSKVFMMIGTNDLWLPDSPEQIVENIQAIVKRLNQSENTNIYVQTLMPVESGHEMTGKIIDINNILRSMDHLGFTLIDINLEMADNNGALPNEFTTDGVHLTSLAYQHWSSLLKPYVNHE